MLFTAGLLVSDRAGDIWSIDPDEDDDGEEDVDRCSPVFRAAARAYDKPHPLQSESGPNGPLRHCGDSVVRHVVHTRCTGLTGSVEPIKGGADDGPNPE